MYCVIDSQRRVWAFSSLPNEAEKKLEEIRKAIMARRVPRPPDPRTLRVVKYKGEIPEHVRSQ